VTGTAATEEAAKKSFSDRINRKFEWAGDHRIVTSRSGDMAYEHGTRHVSYDDKSDGKPHTFDAVMLSVFKAKGAVCQQVAGTMHPLEDTVKWVKAGQGVVARARLRRGSRETALEAYQHALHDAPDMPEVRRPREEQIRPVSTELLDQIPNWRSPTME
jgi:hypothetical protein